MGQCVISRTLKTIQWLVLWDERIKDDVDKSNLFRKCMYKFETSLFHRSVRGSNVHRGIFTRRGDAEKHLCDRKMPCSTYQTHDDSNVRISSLSIRSSQMAGIARTWRQNCHNLSLDQFINIRAISSQVTASVCCQQGSRITGKLYHVSVETCQRHQKSSR